MNSSAPAPIGVWSPSNSVSSNANPYAPLSPVTVPSQSNSVLSAEPSSAAASIRCSLPLFGLSLPTAAGSGLIGASALDSPISQ
eukprot:CAMPEP_0194342886 /NCGR_PEP_ID=MMETSP0171-20130528/94255_1 /TAXON_ID=218684 /ORGANISM="Corethron pennatum, Strain L29A3" /LENGTH=83 /DNA_ID=CAMNT_0039108811 /DNA_START=70 /DNA_END=321 /DNA_ORIENTATION=+